MGTRAFVEGFMHTQWEEIQAQYLTDTHSRMSPRRRMRLLIQKMWLVSWDMWDARNGIVHDDQETRQQQIGAALDTAIEELHQRGCAH